MAQYARPTSDIVVGGWGPTPLANSLDEAVPSETDRIASVAGSSSDTAEMALSAVTDPNVATGYVLRIRYRKDSPGGTSQVNLTVILRQGPSVEIQRWVLTDIPYEWTTTELSLGVSETDSISEHGALRVRLIKEQV